MEEDKLVQACSLLEEHLKDFYRDWEGSKQFKGTSERLVRMYRDYCWPEEKYQEELKRQFKVIEEREYTQMLVMDPISVWTLCPHHLLPVNLMVIIGYLPKNYVIGLSKLVRVAVIVGKRPIMQEHYSVELAKVLFENLQPHGLGVHIIGSHGCMKSRGVLQNVSVTTSRLEGSFLTDESVKSEFLAKVNAR